MSSQCFGPKKVGSCFSQAVLRLPPILEPGLLGLDETSLTHSLLFVTAHPLVIVIGMLVLASFHPSVRTPHRTEIYGAMVCFLGAGITLLDNGASQGDQTVTVFGDSLAFLGAVFVVGYIVVGRILRTWMPIFLYAFPVTLIGAIVLLPFSYALETGIADFGAVGWVDSEYFIWFFVARLNRGSSWPYRIEYMPSLHLSFGSVHCSNV